MRSEEKSERTAKYEKFVGLNNKAEPRTMAPGELTLADNIDIDDRNRIRRRRGFSIAKEIAGVSAAWATPDERRLFVVADGSLYEIRGDDYSEVQLATGLGSGPIWFDWDTQRVFVVSSTAAFVVDGMQAYKMDIPPGLSPSLREVNGNLPEGRYLVASVFQDANGRQGAAGPLQQITLPAGGGIQISTIGLSGYKIRHYVSQTNGTTVRALQGTGTTQNVTDIEQLGAVLEEAQYGAQGMPLGGPIAYHNGRLFMAVYQPEIEATGVWFSKPYWPHLFDMSRDGFIIDGSVNLLADIPGKGLLIGTDRAIYVRGMEEELVQLADYGTVPGQQNFYRDDVGNVYLWTEDGIAKALPLEPLTESRLSAAAGSKCAVGVVKEGGFDRLMVGTHVEVDDEASNPR